jgi:hypothetical protein
MVDRVWLRRLHSIAGPMTGAVERAPRARRREFPEAAAEVEALKLPTRIGRSRNT